MSAADAATPTVAVRRTDRAGMVKTGATRADDTAYSNASLLARTDTAASPSIGGQLSGAKTGSRATARAGAHAAPRDHPSGIWGYPFPKRAGPARQIGLWLLGFVNHGGEANALSQGRPFLPTATRSSLSEVGPGWRPGVRLRPQFPGFEVHRAHRTMSPSDCRRPATKFPKRDLRR